MSIVFCAPVPIAVPSAPVTANDWLALVVQVLAASAPTGDTSKYLPVEFPNVEVVMKILPPPGPVSPTL